MTRNSRSHATYRVRPPSEPPEGYTWEPHEEEREGWHAWRIIPPERDRLCADHDCLNPAVVELNRMLHRGTGRVDAWWAYCPEHMYGRWIDGQGRIVSWRLVKAPA